VDRREDGAEGHRGKGGLLTTTGPAQGAGAVDRVLESASNTIEPATLAEARSEVEAALTVAPAVDPGPSESLVAQELSGAPSVRPQVLHVVTRYLRGGSEARIRDIVRSFQEADHHLVVGADSDAELVQAQVAATVTVMKSLVREPSPWNDAATVVKLARLLKRQGFHLVVTHQSKAGVLGRVAARLAGGPPAVHSLSMANFGPGYRKWEDLLFRVIEARLERVTAAYVVVGYDLAGRYGDIGVPQDKLHVVRSGLRLPMIDGERGDRDPLLQRLGLPDHRPLVLHLGSLEPRKNVLDLGRYLRHLLSFDSATRPFLVVAGEGPLASALMTMFRREELMDDAALVGFVDEPGPLIAAADAMILLSRAEGVPQVLVQAAAAATPFVAYDVDGVRELVGLGADGTVVPLGDVAAAAEATAHIIGRGAERTGASIDLTSWSTEVIDAEYRRVMGSFGTIAQAAKRRRLRRRAAQVPATTIVLPNDGAVPKTSAPERTPLDLTGNRT
jgi:glycosyltransferase involved in cell wall biosynthesis